MRGETRPVEVRASKAPQHHLISRLYQPPKEGCGKGGGERAIFLVAVSSYDFMQSASCKPATRQRPVDRRDAAGQDSVYRRGRPLDPPEALTKLREKSFLRNHVPFLFSRL